MSIVVEGEKNGATVELVLEYGLTGALATIKVQIKDEWLNVEVRKLHDAVNSFRPWIDFLDDKVVKLIRYEDMEETEKKCGGDKG